jgi:hypothetical protein
MERELILVGATAVEDKLQKGVGFIIIYGQYILILPPFYILIMFKFLFFSGASMH